MTEIPLLLSLLTQSDIILCRMPCLTQPYVRVWTSRLSFTVIRLTDMFEDVEDVNLQSVRFHFTLDYLVHMITELFMIVDMVNWFSTIGNFECISLQLSGNVASKFDDFQSDPFTSNDPFGYKNAHVEDPFHSDDPFASNGEFDTHFVYSCSCMPSKHDSLCMNAIKQVLLSHK